MFSTAAVLHVLSTADVHVPSMAAVLHVLSTAAVLHVLSTSAVLAVAPALFSASKLGLDVWSTPCACGWPPP